MDERGRSSGPVNGSQVAAAALPIALALSLGVLAGIGSFTFNYAEGLSYLSTDPRACVNCHIMQPQFDGWQKASHHSVAVCVDCHLPRGFFQKYLVKAENGWRHGKLFTTQTFAEPIFVQAPGRQVLQENCVGCHQGLVHGLAPGQGPDTLGCVHCHAEVGHGPRGGLGGPLRPAELVLDSPIESVSRAR
jgi:cytochrome c nitrite reductase small subunit